jgi:predicted aspartyl protease
MKYPYQVISIDPLVPPAPILRVSLFNPSQEQSRLYELDAFLDTGADCTLIPLEAVSVLRLAFLAGRVPVCGVGGATTRGFLCKTGVQLGELCLPEIKIVACEAVAIGRRDQMIIGRDILNLCCVKFDGRRQQFSFEPFI